MVHLGVMNVNPSEQDSSDLSKMRSGDGKLFGIPKVYIYITGAVFLVLGVVGISVAMFAGAPQSQDTMMQDVTHFDSENSATFAEDARADENIAPYEEKVLAVAKNVKDSVLQVQSDTAGGTGFLIHEDGYILTNKHVVSEKTDYWVKTIDGQKFNVEVVARSQDFDIDAALLKTTGEAPSVEPLSFAMTKVGEDDLLFAVGHPGVFGNWAVTAGKFLSESKKGEVWVDKPGSQGESGSPLFNMNGKIVGLIYGAENHPDREKLNQEDDVVVHWDNAPEYWNDLTTAENVTVIKTFLGKHLSPPIMNSLFNS